MDFAIIEASRAVLVGAIIWFAVVLGGCGSLPPPGPELSDDATAAEECAAMCERVTVLNCEGWEGNVGPDAIAGTDDDATCEDACVDIQSVVNVDAQCVVTSRSCGEVDACGAL